MLFQPPKDVPSEVFARVPDKFRKKRRSSWADGNHRGAELDCFLEGPSFDRHGNLYVTDIPFGRIFRISPDGGDWTLVAEYDGEPNGLKFHQDGRAFITDYRRGVMVLDPASGKVEPFFERRSAESLRGVNDLVFGAGGELYFTDQGQTGLHDPTGRVYRLKTDGKLDCLIANGPSPNGLVLNKDESILYVCMTRGNAVWRVPLTRDGGVTKVGIFVQLSGGLGGPDGMALDADDGIVVCHVGLGCAWHFSRLGEPLHRIRSCAGLGTTNVAFGGPERRAVFITESITGQILKAELPVAGWPLYPDRS